jgi:hypothetical protein
MTAMQFFNKYNKKRLDFDGVNGGQCVDVAKAFYKEVFRITPIRGNGIDYWYKSQPKFKRIKNTVWARTFRRPAQGNIVVWGTGVGEYGHVAIANGTGNSRVFDSFEQNYPLWSVCHVQRHDYKNVIGWLRKI